MPARAFYALLVASLAPAETVYLYAQRDTPASTWIPVYVDGAPAADLRRGAFFAAHLRLDWNHHVNRPPIPVLSLIPQARAGKEMMFLSYIPASKIHVTAVPKNDPRQPAFQTRPSQ